MGTRGRGLGRDPCTKVGAVAFRPELPGKLSCEDGDAIASLALKLGFWSGLALELALGGGLALFTLD